MERKNNSLETITGSQKIKWISVEDCLPADIRAVLVYHNGGSVGSRNLFQIWIAWYDREGKPDSDEIPPAWKEKKEKWIELHRWCSFQHLLIGEVTHWMPLPEAPSEYSQILYRQWCTKQGFQNYNHEEI